jgi:uncharacterized repeat protein (TIGR03803 family)
MSVSGHPKSVRRVTSVLTLLFVGLALATAASAQTLTTLHEFDGPNGESPYREGLVQGADGSFYGTTEMGGVDNYGVVFKLALDGTYTVVHEFVGTDGEYPSSGLVQDALGNMYGTTRIGGLTQGVIYKITPQGTFSVVSGGSGGVLYAPVLLASDGLLYGVSYNGNTIFRVGTDGSNLQALYTLCTQTGCPDGTNPVGGLVEGPDHNFYGTANRGGGSNAGTIFRVTPDGAFTLLHSFGGASDGFSPRAKMLVANDGYLWGTTNSGGNGNGGTVFKIKPDGSNFTVVYAFCPNSHCPVGNNPEAGLIQAPDGNFYGTTAGNGQGGAGAVYRLTPAGVATSLHDFANNGGGSNPFCDLLLGFDGNFYGTTRDGGSANDGTVFRLTGPGVISTTTTLTTTPNPSQLNQTVMMTATVHAQNGATPTGNVLFTSDGVTIGTGVLVSGVAVLNYSSLALGTHNVVAAYEGGNGFGGSISNTVQQVVQLAPSATVVTSTPNPSVFGQQVTITATVGPNGPPQPTGTVSFTSNGSAIAGCSSVQLSSQMAQCVTSALAVGTDAVIGAYSGDGNYAPSNGTLTQIVNPVPSPLQFVAVTPCRIVDTRNPNGPFGGPPIPARTARSFPLTEGDNPCGIPTSAVAYSLNVTVVPQTTLGFLTIWPTGEGQPTVSTMNSPDGRTKANAAIVPAGAPGGGVSVYVTQTTNVILDINGYFKPADGTTLEFYPVTPCRVADTRNPNGPLGGPPLMGTVERDFPVLSSTCNLPSTAVAYSLNFTAVPLAGHLGFLTVWPQGQPRPTVSTLNDPTGTTVANAAIVPAGTSGGVATYASQDTNLIIDVNGYFAPPGTGGLSLYVLTPCRVLDTRNGNGAFSGELTVHVMSSFCEVTGSARAYVFNATVLPVHNLGFLTLWPDGQTQPTVSTLNAPDGAITSNMAIVPTNNGSIDAYASQATQLILDISSYFAP